MRLQRRSWRSPRHFSELFESRHLATPKQADWPQNLDPPQHLWHLSRRAKRSDEPIHPNFHIPCPTPRTLPPSKPSPTPKARYLLGRLPVHNRAPPPAPSHLPSASYATPRSTTAVPSPSPPGAQAPQWTPVQQLPSFRQYPDELQQQQQQQSPPAYIHQSYRPIYSGGVAQAQSHSAAPGPYLQSLSTSHHAPLHPAAASSPVSSNKRTASRALGTGNGDPGAGGGSAAKKEKKLKGKWTEEEEKLLIKLRSSGMKWVDISQQNPGRSATACRLRYQNYTEKKEWGEDEKDMLARLYHRGEMQLASDPQKIIDELVST
ncbi:myb DNA-binding domain protein [Botryosphaeria dothidea]|uniref:Myb DNA-binding domain protein n=1 Tax=Botryosphaeria dothidea TaxID=55169 RepID=A0A8H4JAY7_9PEZI|nr:myb DNA-binding domain protein [Botryosphaeria dothidea]